MRRAFLIPLLLFLVSPHAGCGQSPSWSVLKKNIRAAHPDIRHISSDSLAAWLASPVPAPLLLDVRAEAEFAVSHLPHARRLDPDTPDLTLLQDLPPDTPMVTYCSVGYRSSAMAERLREWYERLAEQDPASGARDRFVRALKSDAPPTR